jgi:uracil-DNA glycosylase
VSHLSDKDQAFTRLLKEVRSCTSCAPSLPAGPRPVLQAHPDARILLVGQAPGRKVHASGVPFDDASGERLRAWLGMDHDTFYDERQVAILPMGFCFPGTGTSGDLPPRPECAPLWRERLLAGLPHIRLTVLLGRYAQQQHLPSTGRGLTEVVADWRAHAPAVFVLPHPSPRNQAWFKRHPWLAAEVVPALQAAVSKALA